MDRLYIEENQIIDRYLMNKLSTEEAEAFEQFFFYITAVHVHAFLRATAKNVLIGDARKEARRKTFANSDIVAAVPDRQPGPASQVNRAAEAKIVRELINKMRSERDKALLLRFYINEEDKSDICAELNLSSIHFNRVLFRARRRFKDLLTQYENDNDERIRG